LQNKTIANPYGFVYIITNLINGKRYVGQRKFDDNGKWKYYMGSGTQIVNAIKKYGKENFIRDIIYIAYTDEELSVAEQNIITALNAGDSRDYYNISDGYWEYPLKHKTLEELHSIKQKMSISRSMYLKNRTPEQVKHTSEASSKSLKKFYATNPEQRDKNNKHIASHCEDFWKLGDERKKVLAKQKISDKAKIRTNNPEVKQQLRERALLLMKDPEDAINDHVNHIFSNPIKQQISDTLMQKFSNGDHKSAKAMDLIINNQTLSFTTKKFAYCYLIDNEMLYYRTKDPNKQMSYSLFKRLTYDNETFPNFTYKIFDKNDGEIQK
jgi:group I intron endonuclease